MGKASETSSAAGPTSKPSPLTTTVRFSIPAIGSPTTKPSSSTAATKGTTRAGSGSLGSVISVSPSLLSKATVTKSSISSTTHEGNTTTPGGPKTTSVEHMMMTQSSKAQSEVLVTTTAKSLGSHGTATAGSPGATPHVLSTGTKVIVRATSPSLTPPGVLLPAGDSSATRPTQSEIICEKETPKESQLVILTLNESRTCQSLRNSHLEKKLVDLICQARAPNFNQSRDQCTVRMASSTTDTKHLAIIDASVTINSVAKELFDSLIMNKGELEKLGVSNVTHSGRTEDINMEDRFSMPLIITIVCMAASLLLVAAIYGCCHQRLSQRKDQRLTEELQTMENGYHDNPTLEVMETLSEMQEKKVNLNGELGDSWIVPMDNLTREDLEEEEDTHL
ncbi:podocalyxin isoform X2 [Tiliqua scincoides]|uniref:podocalyxin isoform X2 n=1 Tax=Tiliqua scincoides TaxID=71010 RepID=UPI0034634AF5